MNRFVHVTGVFWIILVTLKEQNLERQRLEEEVQRQERLRMDLENVEGWHALPISSSCHCSPFCSSGKNSPSSTYGRSQKDGSAVGGF